MGRVSKQSGPTDASAMRTSTTTPQTLGGGPLTIHPLYPTFIYYNNPCRSFPFVLLNCVSFGFVMKIVRSLLPLPLLARGPSIISGLIWIFRFVIFLSALILFLLPYKKSKLYIKLGLSDSINMIRCFIGASSQPSFVHAILSWAHGGVKYLGHVLFSFRSFT